MPCKTERIADQLRKQLDSHLQIYRYRVVARTSGIPWTKLRRFHLGMSELTLTESELLAETVGAKLHLDLPSINKWPGQIP